MNKEEVLNSHIPAYVCSHIFNNTRPILYVCKDDGDWQFLCGHEHNEDEIPRVVGLGHLFMRDPSLFNIVDLQDDWEAERSSPINEWAVHPIV